MHLRNLRHTLERLREVNEPALASLYTPTSFGVIGQVLSRV